MKLMSKLGSNKNLQLEDIELARTELRKQIKLQQELLTVTTREVTTIHNPIASLVGKRSSFSPLSLLSAPVRNRKTYLFMQGMVLGYRGIKKMRRAVRK